MHEWNHPADPGKSCDECGQPATLRTVTDSHALILETFTCPKHPPRPHRIPTFVPWARDEVC
ncbi:MAG: hypothetical protein NVSMB65_14570 [Chloroflexota bacterium]